MLVQVHGAYTILRNVKVPQGGVGKILGKMGATINELVAMLPGSQWVG